MISGFDREHFRRRGYCVLPDAVSSADLSMLSRTVDELLTEELDPEHHINKGNDRRFLALRHEEFGELEAFVLGESIGQLAGELLTGPPHLFVEQFVVKGPRTGASFAWHQDGGYVGFAHPPYLSLWIAIDDATEANGCLSVLPRDLDHNTDIADHDWDEANKERVGYSGDDPGVLVECEAGSIVAFSSTTMHRSGPNTTERPRRAFVAQYSAEPIIDPTTGQPHRFAKRLAEN